MELVNLSVDRIIIHQVFKRDEDGSRVAPLQSHDFVNFDNSAMNAFKSRVINALGDNSGATPMTVVNQDPTDVPTLVNIIVEKNDDDFAVSSFDFAEKLANAQLRRDLPGGILVIFTGNYGVPRKKYLGIIKAEIYSGYEVTRDSDTNEISLNYIEDLLLAPSSRMYKTAAFFSNSVDADTPPDLNDKWSVLLSDFQMTTKAHYFHEGFLGCGHPETSARTTMQFYNSTCKFIRSMDVEPVAKSDLLNALTTYLKVDTSPTASVTDFATKYLDTDTQDQFGDYMDNKGISKIAFTKDIVDIEKNLKTRKVKFRSNVNISAPSDAFKDLVVIEPIEGDPDENGIVPAWTRVTIKDSIVDQE